MGQSGSHHSSKSDTLPNLQWSLNELMLWRQRCHDGEMTDDGVRKLFAKSRKDDAMPAPIPPSTNTGIGATTSVPAGMEGKSLPATATGYTAQTQPTPDVDRFAASYQVPATYTGTFAGSSSAFNTAEPGVSYPVGQTGIEEAIVDPEVMAEVDRADTAVINEKYSFILDHLHKLVQGAEENYMILCKENWMKSQQSKINTSHPSGPTSKAEYDRRIHENATFLGSRLNDFDNARMAIQWLQRHFELLMQRRALGREITHINFRIKQLQSEKPSDATVDELRHLRQRLNGAHVGVSNATRQARQLRRESLEVGLQYLDTNQSGSIEPDDQPNLSAELFSRLDTRNKHRIRPSDLQNAVDKMEKNCDNLSKNIYDTQREIDKLVNDRERVLTGVAGEAETEKRRVKGEELNVEIRKRDTHIQQLKLEKEREEALLRETYSTFQRAFVDSLFAKLGGRPEDRAKYESFYFDMEAIERNIKNLHIAADQGHKGLDASRLAGVGAVGRASAPSSPVGSKEIPKQTISGFAGTGQPSSGGMMQQPSSGLSSGYVGNDPLQQAKLGQELTGQQVKQAQFDQQTGVKTGFSQPVSTTGGSTIAGDNNNPSDFR